MAPYLPPGSDRQSAFFKTISRVENDKLQKQSRKGLADTNYEPRMSHVRQKPICLVRLDPSSTAKKLNRKVRDICSKGKNDCRHSNIRIAQKLDKLQALSPRIEEYSVSNANGIAVSASIESGSIKPGSQMTFRGDGGIGGNRLSLGNQPDKVRKKVTGSAPRKFMKKQIRPPQGDRSSSTMLVNDLSNLRD